jgi:hypothetical protein
MKNSIPCLAPGRTTAVITIALATAFHGARAHAGALALCGPVVLSGVDTGAESPVTLPPAADLDAAAAHARDEFETAFNAGVTDNILRAVFIGLPAYARPAPTHEPDLRAAFAARLHGAAPTSPSLAALANPTIGQPQGVAVSFAQHLVSTGEAAAGLNSDLHVRHQTDGLDAGFDLAGRQNFVAPDPMTVSYDSHALVAVNSAMKLGVSAHGSLGSINSMAFNSNAHSAGPLLHLNLIDRNVSLMSDVGYDFGLNPMTTAARSQLHVAMNLKLKL